jgi:hypothetical protein
LNKYISLEDFSYELLSIDVILKSQFEDAVRIIAIAFHVSVPVGKTVSSQKEREGPIYRKF